MNVGVMCMHCPLCLPATDALVRGGNIEELISSGLELLSSLISHGSSIEDLKCFMEQMLEQLVHSAHASILFLIRVSCVSGREVWMWERVVEVGGRCGGGSEMWRWEVGSVRVV